MILDIKKAFEKFMVLHVTNNYYSFPLLYLFYDIIRSLYSLDLYSFSAITHS